MPRETENQIAQRVLHEISRRIVWTIALHGAISRGQQGATHRADAVADSALEAFDKRFPAIKGA